MIWVIFVHVLYWGEFFQNSTVNLVKSFFLFEMPLFFFVTGASNSLGKNDGYFPIVFRRYKRFLIPYWFFAVICAILTIARTGVCDGIEPASALKILFSWLLPLNRQITTIPYLTFALWFVPVYLCVIVTVPILRRIKESKIGTLFLFLFVLVYILTCFSALGKLQKVVFYALWTYIGLFYRDITAGLHRPHFKKYAGLISAAGVVIMVTLYFAGYSLDMQYNKFPPNAMFAAFSMAIMPLIIMSIPHINKICDRIKVCKFTKAIFDLYAYRSMTIFLYQVFAFNITIELAYILIPGTGILISLVKSLLCLITTVPLCAGLAMIFGKIEEIGVVRKTKDDVSV